MCHGSSPRSVVGLSGPRDLRWVQRSCQEPVAGARLSKWGPDEKISLKLGRTIATALPRFQHVDWVRAATVADDAVGTLDAYLKVSQALDHSVPRRRPCEASNGSWSTSGRH